MNRFRAVTELSQRLCRDISTSALLVAAVAGGLAPQATALSLGCENIVKENHFNRRSVAISERLIENIKADVCNREFESVESARSYLREGGWDLNVFGFFDNSLTDRKRNKNSKYEVRHSDFCDKSSSELSSSFGSNYLDVNGEFALQAFEACVKSMSANSTILTYELHGAGAGQLISGELTRYAGGKQNTLSYQLYGFQVVPESAGVKCTFTGHPIPKDISRERPVEIQDSPAGLLCEREKDAPVIIQLQTTQGAFKIYSPSAKEVEETTISKLRDELRATRERLSDAIARTEEIDVELAAKSKELAEETHRVYKFAQQVQNVANQALKPGSSVRLLGNDDLYIYSNQERNRDELDVFLHPEKNNPNTLWRLIAP